LDAFFATAIGGQYTGVTRDNAGERGQDELTESSFRRPSWPELVDGADGTA
jgi:hypothetical protein